MSSTAAPAETGGRDEVTLVLDDDHSFPLRTLTPSLGRPRIQAADLPAAGYGTYDSGFANTAAYRSAITYVDGEKGVLLFRGYPAQDLAARRSYLDVAALLTAGELPESTAAKALGEAVAADPIADDARLRDLLDRLPGELHPMAFLAAAIGMLSAFPTSAAAGSEAGSAERGEVGGTGIDADGVRLLAVTPFLAACAFAKAEGRSLPQSKPELGYVENFLQMCFPDREREELLDPTTVRLLEALLILHADHEQNCSTAALRLVGSAGAGFFAGASAAVNALWGPLHGGANQAVIEMLEDIEADGGDIDKYISMAKDRKNSFRLMGFGHRIYKTTDARAQAIREMALPLVTARSQADPLVDIALRLRDAVAKDDYFVSRHLYPNVDFYSGLIYRALGFPAEIFTPLFVVGRAAGWIAQWRELMADPESRIGRPSQLYVGETQRPVPA